jgi:glyoxylase-like metal-dependent hydrolase (beta-lactamase superfamily II)
MRIRNPGKVRERLWFLGREESGVYLLEGKDGFMIVNGGMSYIVPDLLRQLKEFGIAEEKITKLLILHAHFDHVGVVPFFKRRYPKLEVYASSRGWEILQMEKAINTINEFSRTVTKKLGKEEVYSTFDLDWRDDVTGRPFAKGSESIWAVWRSLSWRFQAIPRAALQPMSQSSRPYFQRMEEAFHLMKRL